MVFMVRHLRGVKRSSIQPRPRQSGRRSPNGCRSPQDGPLPMTGGPRPTGFSSGASFHRRTGGDGQPTPLRVAPFTGSDHSIRLVPIAIGIEVVVAIDHETSSTCAAHWKPPPTTNQHGRPAWTFAGLAPCFDDHFGRLTQPSFCTRCGRKVADPGAVAVHGGGRLQSHQTARPRRAITFALLRHFRHFACSARNVVSRGRHRHICGRG